MTTQQPDQTDKDNNLSDQEVFNAVNGFINLIDCLKNRNQVEQPDPLDDLLHEYTITHMGNSHNAQCRCIGGSKSHLKYEINALMIPRKEVEAAIPKQKNKSLIDPDDGSNNHAFRLGYNKAIRDIRSALNIKPEGKQLEAKGN